MWLKPIEITNSFVRQLKQTEIKLRLFTNLDFLLPFTLVNGFVECNKQKGFNPILISIAIFNKCLIQLNNSG